MARILADTSANYALLVSFSYVDATSFSVMERLGIRQAFTFDPHFEQYGCEPLR